MFIIFFFLAHDMLARHRPCGNRTIRPLPHQDLILGHVGLPPCAADATSAPAAVVAGRVLVRPTSTQNNIIKAHKLEISLVKLDVLGLKPQNRVTSTVAHQQLWAKTAEQNSLSGEVRQRCSSSALEFWVRAVSELSLNRLNFVSAWLFQRMRRP